MSKTQKAVRAILEESGLSTSELCRRYGALPQLLTPYKAGDRNMGLNMFFGLCRAAGVKPSEILDLVEKGDTAK